MDSVYHPFIYFVWLSCISEVVSEFLIRNGHYTYISENIYSLPEFLLLLMFFKNIDCIKGRTYQSTFIILIMLWLFDSFVLKKFNSGTNDYFNLTASLVIVILAINKVNTLVSTTKGSLIVVPVFIVSISVIIYFTYNILIKSFWNYGLQDKKDNWAFLTAINNILHVIILLTNVLYAIAIGLFPKKEPYSVFLL